MLVRVRASGCGPDVWHLMTGMPYMARPMIGFRRPKIAVPGWDVAGTVEAVGAKVTGLELGDEVMGTAKGSFAEFVITQPDKLVPKPANLTFDQAAAVPISGTTALRAVLVYAFATSSLDRIAFAKPGANGNVSIRLAMTLVRML